MRILPLIYRGAVWPCAMAVWAFGFFNRPVEKAKINPPVERTEPGRPISNTWLVAALASSHFQNGRRNPMRDAHQSFLRMPDRLQPVSPPVSGDAWK